MDVWEMTLYSGRMARHFETLSDILSHGADTLIDVRSPAEYAEDHIPGAISLPVLDDNERARVGTIYVQDNAFRARKIGAALVARNAAKHLEGPLSDKDGAWQPLVYCWRGGQRSGSFASILSQVGWRAGLVEGGYRSYRRLVVAAMYDTPLPHRLILLDGNTGTAKTKLLSLLAARGVQVVDLEGLARHRGSVFGGLDAPQPTQKEFESTLAEAFDRLDPEKPVILEAESSKVGARLIPASVWTAMRHAARIRVTVPLGARAEYLTRAYGDMLEDRQAMKETLAKLTTLQGRETVETWQAMVDAGQFRALAGDLMERHYDPRYRKSRSRGDVNVIGEIQTSSLTPEALEKATDRIAALI